MARPAKSIEQHKKEGTYRSRHKKKEEEMPKLPVVTIEECPGLSVEARKYWPTFREMLQKMTYIAEVDILSVQRLVETYAEIRQYQTALKKDGLFYTSETRMGVITRAHPGVAALADADRRFRGYMADFGMSPSSRSRLKGNGDGNPQDKDPLQEFI